MYFFLTPTEASHGRFSYLKCNAKQYNQDEEHKVATHFFVSPDNIQYYRLSPDFYYSARDLRTRVKTKHYSVSQSQIVIKTETFFPPFSLPVTMER